GSQAYYNHPCSLADPVCVTGGASMYPWLQFIPGVVIAKILGLGSISINLVWRIIAGVSVTLGWFVITRHYIKHSWGAGGLTVFLLSDIGLIYGRPLFRQVMICGQVILGRPGGLFDALPQVHTQWRIITPSLSLAFLLLYLWLVARSRENPTWPRLIWSGIGL